MQKSVKPFLFRIIKTAFCALFLLALSSCGYIAGSITKVGSNLSPVINKLDSTQGGEIVSSSNQVTTTLHGYKVQSSAGSYLDQLEVKTANGYTVDSTVQGTLLED